MTDSAPQPPSVGLIVGCSLSVFFVLVCVTGVPVVGMLAAIAIPNFVSMQMKAKRAEVPTNVDGIRIAELAYHAAFDEYAACGDEQTAALQVGKTQRSTAGDETFSCLAKTLGWSPDGLVRGAYWVVVTDGDFEVNGIADVDGDGVYAHYRATKDQSATMVSYPNDY